MIPDAIGTLFWRMKAVWMVAVCFAVFDCWAFPHLPLVALLVFLLILPSLLIVAVLSIFRKYRSTAIKALACIAILFLGVLADAGAHQLRRSRINSRVVRLGDACLAYRAKYKHYPEQLDDLVPEFISSVQAASPTLLGEDDFHYSSHDGPEPFIYYQCLQPFGHCYYYVESRCWRYLD